LAITIFFFFYRGGGGRRGDFGFWRDSAGETEADAFFFRFFSELSFRDGGEVVPVAQDWLDPQVGAESPDFLEGRFIQGVDHGHGQDAAQFIDGQQFQPQAHFFGNEFQGLLIDAVVQQVQVGDIELFHHELPDGIVGNEAEGDEALTEKSAVFLLMFQAFSQLLGGNDAFFDQQFPQTFMFP